MDNTLLERIKEEVEVCVNGTYGGSLYVESGIEFNIYFDRSKPEINIPVIELEWLQWSQKTTKAEMAITVAKIIEVLFEGPLSDYFNVEFNVLYHDVVDQLAIISWLSYEKT